MAFRINIDGKNVDFFTAGSITLKLDSIASTFEFASRFSAQNKEHQEMFKPLQYKEVQIFNSNNKLIFTGTILNHRFKSNSGRELVIISGYSKTGILEDVTIPVSSYPLESTNRSLKDIAEKLNAAFNKVLKDPEVKKSLQSIGAQVDGGSVAEFTKFSQSEIKRYEGIVKMSGAPRE